ncbi:MAG TPA: TIGR03560 family F420-dependent LLM class oxidoreductase [Candidatus Limnocylindria bacterium]|nr:TIGR03560 family F420-dependent LLM class oxidoreductase [Candidatus Limnocylindria bacterium]
MKLGVIVSPAAGWTYDELREIANETEAAGFESFWVSDHFFGGEGVPDQDCLEAWTLLAALARDTRTVRLGCLVTAAQYRNPALLAKIVAGVDQMSGGRIEFGIGAGWKDNEYRAYGYDFGDPGRRVTELREALEICTRLWTQDRATFHGKRYRVDGAVCAPKPAQRPHPPIWVGGAGPRVMRIAARFADGFDIGHNGSTGLSTADDLRERMRALDDACRWVRRDRPLLRSQWSAVELTDAASVRTVRERLASYAGLGLDRFLFQLPKERAGAMVRRARTEELLTRP